MLTTAIVTGVATAIPLSVAMYTSNPHDPPFVQLRTHHHITPVDSTLHERSVMRMFLKGLHVLDPDYLVGALKNLTMAFKVHHQVNALASDLLLDTLVSMMQKHCRLHDVYTRLHTMNVDWSSGCEQTWACCQFLMAVQIAMMQSKQSKQNL